MLARYLATRYLRAFLLLSGVFLAILLLIDMVEQIRRFAPHGVTLAGAARLSALSVAGSFYQILPLVALLAGISLFLALSRSSEMVAIRASGRSALRAVAAPAVTAALVGVATVAVLNPIVAATEGLYASAVSSIESGAAQTVSLGEGALWLRQGGGPDGGQVMIRASHASPDATTLFDVTFLLFSASASPAARVEADEAMLQPGRWELRGVTTWTLTAANPELEAERSDSAHIPTDLTADRIRDGFGRPQAVPIWSLPQYIDGLKRAGFSAVRYQVWLQMEIALPLTLMAMVAIASVFTLRHMRGRRSGLLVLWAFGAGLALFFLRSMAQVLGDSGGVPAALAGWAPPLIGLLLATGALLYLEDG